MGRWRPVRFAGTIVAMTTYEPGVYEKGDVSKRAATPSEAVALAFQGFKRVDESDETPPNEGKELGDYKVDDEPAEDVNPDAPELPAPDSPLDGAEPDFDAGSPSEENTSAELEAHQSGRPEMYTF